MKTANEGPPLDPEGAQSWTEYIHRVERMIDDPDTDAHISCGSEVMRAIREKWVADGARRGLLIGVALGGATMMWLPPVIRWLWS